MWKQDVQPNKGSHCFQGGLKLSLLECESYISKPPSPMSLYFHVTCQVTFLPDSQFHLFPFSLDPAWCDSYMAGLQQHKLPPLDTDVSLSPPPPFLSHPLKKATKWGDNISKHRKNCTTALWPKGDSLLRKTRKAGEVGGSREKEKMVKYLSALSVLFKLSAFSALFVLSALFE